MKRPFILLLLSVVLGFCPKISRAQYPIKSDPSLGEKYFSQRNYKAALSVYLLLLKSDPKNVDYNLKVARCYLLSHSIKSKAIPHLEFVVAQPKFDYDAWLDLAKAYHYGNQFDKAINCYNKYKEKNAKKSDEVDRYIEQCVNGKELIKRSLDVTFENLGKNINSEFPDYYPFVSADDQTLVFTTRRKSTGGPEPDGFFPSDIFITNKKGDAWGKAVGIGGNVNTALDEQVTYLAQDGNTILYYIDYIDIMGDLYMSKRINGKGAFLKPSPLPSTVNSGFETSGSIWVSPDGETEVLYFASSRPDNLGQTDIYSCKRIPKSGPNGEVMYDWGTPVNLGPNINTKWKEEFPMVSPDGKTLYFASEGHSSMGGFDIFKSVWDEDENQWSKPRNLGYPINTADDELTISFVPNSRIAYISAMREDGLGDLDIYRVILNDMEGSETIFRGLVLGSDSLTRLKDAIIHVENKKTNEEYGTYIPDKNKWYYIMALPPGKWRITIEADGYSIYEEDIVLFDFAGFKPEIEKNFRLKK
jgi:hypothetical protein